MTHTHTIPRGPTVKPHLTVPLSDGAQCGQRNPKTGKPCRRAKDHHGRHAFIWRHAIPGKVREVWG